MSEIKKENLKKMIRNDIILVCSVIACVLLLSVFIFMGSSSGEWVVVSVDGREVARYPLAEDGEYSVFSGENSENLNRVQVKDGKASVIEASCPDGVCVAHRPISKTVETIICLPNKVTVYIESGSGSGLDMIS